DLVAADDVRLAAVVWIDLRGGRVALADQVAADRVGHDLAGIVVDLPRDWRIDKAVDHAGVVVEDDVAADVVADQADPAACPSLNDQVPLDGVVLRREVAEL